MFDDQPTEDPLTWPLAAYGLIIRGDETTSEDQVATAVSARVADRLVASWNACAGVNLTALQLGPDMNELRALLKEAADHIDGVTGAAARPNSESGDLYARLIAALHGYQ